MNTNNSTTKSNDVLQRYADMRPWLAYNERLEDVARLVTQNDLERPMVPDTIHNIWASPGTGVDYLAEVPRVTRTPQGGLYVDIWNDTPRPEDDQSFEAAWPVLQVVMLPHLRLVLLVTPIDLYLMRAADFDKQVYREYAAAIATKVDWLNEMSGGEDHE